MGQQTAGGCQKLMSSGHTNSNTCCRAKNTFLCVPGYSKTLDHLLSMRILRACHLSTCEIAYCASVPSFEQTPTTLNLQASVDHQISSLYHLLLPHSFLQSLQKMYDAPSLVQQDATQQPICPSKYPRRHREHMSATYLLLHAGR